MGHFSGLTPVFGPLLMQQWFVIFVAFVLSTFRSANPIQWSQELRQVIFSHVATFWSCIQFISSRHLRGSSQIQSPAWFTLPLSTAPPSMVTLCPSSSSRFSTTTPWVSVLWVSWQFRIQTGKAPAQSSNSPHPFQRAGVQCTEALHCIPWLQSEASIQRISTDQVRLTCQALWWTFALNLGNPLQRN